MPTYVDFLYMHGGLLSRFLMEKLDADFATPPNAAAIDLSNVSAAVVANKILISGTLPVPGDLQTAINSLEPFRIIDSFTLTLEGQRTLPATLTLDHVDAERIFIQGEALLTRTFASVTSVSGVAGAYTVRLPLNSYADIVLGNFIAISGTAGGAGHQLLRGAWPITALVPGSYIEFTCTAQAGVIPTGAISGTGKIYRTVLNSPGFTALSFGALGGLSNVALKGDRTVSTFGFVSRSAGDVNMTDVVMFNFGDEGISPRNGLGMLLSRVYSCSNGNNGMNARESGAMIFATDCVCSGNGHYHLPGGGNGFLAQLGGGIEGAACEAWGNWGDGFYARSTGHMLITGGPHAGWNANNFHVAYSGFGQFDSAVANNAVASDYLVEYNGNLLAVAGTSTSAGGNGFTCHSGAMVVSSAVVTSSAFNGFAVVGGGSIDATGSNVVSRGTTAYIATTPSAGRLIMTGATGLLDAVPAVNTYDADFNIVVH